jgi:hypothetical protein
LGRDQRSAQSMRRPCERGRVRAIHDCDEAKTFGAVSPKRVMNSSHLLMNKSPAGRLAKAHSILAKTSTIAGASNVKRLTQAYHYVARSEYGGFNCGRPSCCLVRPRSTASVKGCFRGYIGSLAPLMATRWARLPRTDIVAKRSEEATSVHRRRYRQVGQSDPRGQDQRRSKASSERAPMFRGRESRWPCDFSCGSIAAAEPRARRRRVLLSKQTSAPRAFQEFCTSKSPLIKKSFSGAEYRGRIAP